MDSSDGPEAARTKGLHLGPISTFCGSCIEGWAVWGG